MSNGSVMSAGVGTGFDMIASHNEEQRRQSASDRAKKDLEEQIFAQEQLKAPSIDDLSYDPEVAQYIGDLEAPDIYMPTDLQSQYEQVGVSPEMLAAQTEAMGSMDQIIEGGGMTGMDRLNAQRALDASGQQAAAQQADIQQDMARRGMSGSGQEMLAKLVGSQGGLDRAAASSQETQALAQQRALDAIMNKGSMAGNIRSQNVNEQAIRAKGRDSVNRFNSDMRTSQHNKAAGMEMDAATRNINTKQGLEGSRATNQTDANRYNAGAQQTAYGNKVDKLDRIQGLKEKRRTEGYDSSIAGAKASADEVRNMGDVASSLMSM